MALKYDVWKVSQPKAESVNALTRCGYAPLTAMILSARGIRNGEEARQLLQWDCPLPDPFRMKDISDASARVRLAILRGEKIAVFGDYDVDGITATCLLTDCLRKLGADCLPYIPSRLEEGYGLNEIAIRYLAELGVKLIVTVDCGVTAVEEAALCRQMGVDLVITDHHECKDKLPAAVAVVNPHRPDCGYPHKNLSGVGVAFKLASALCGSQEQVLRLYGDMICLGTVADVMPLVGENRMLVQRGLEQMRSRPRAGVRALVEECGCEIAKLDATVVGFTIAPRINAAGRMGNIEPAVELFLTEDARRAEALAKALCDMNRQRQSVESRIYEEAIAKLPPDRVPEVIVLADASWHQGVVGIVASRIAEEYCRPAVLICLDGGKGKASSRSYGGFNLFAALSALSPLLESYGGHELAAGFTIREENIDRFRTALCALAGQADVLTGTTLTVDCAVPPELMTLHAVERLAELEPCGSGCPKPVLMLERVQVDKIRVVGGGKHMRLWFRRGRSLFSAIYFGATPESAGIAQGDLVDVAFYPQVNEYQGQRTAQLNVVDIHPACIADCSAEVRHYRALRSGTLEQELARALCPDRHLLGMIWRYLASVSDPVIEETPMCLCRKIVRWSGAPLSLEQLLVCLDIFTDVGLMETARFHKNLTIRLTPREEKADLMTSRTMRLLLGEKE